MKTLALLLVSAGVALAQYGDAPSYPAQDAPPATGGYGAPAAGGYGAPAPTPVGYPWPAWGRYHDSSSSESRSRSKSRRRSRSRSSSNSDEHRKKKCGSCRRLTTLPAVEGSLSTSISYFKDSDGCRNAVITCPFNGASFSAILVSSATETEGITSAGVSTQTVAHCNNRGGWESTVIPLESLATLRGKTQEFKSVGCFNTGITSLPTQE